MGAMYMECSSKEMTGVDEIFDRAIQTVVENDRSNATQDFVGQGQAVGSARVGGMKRKKRNCGFL